MLCVSLIPLPPSPFLAQPDVPGRCFWHQSCELSPHTISTQPQGCTGMSLCCDNPVLFLPGSCSQMEIGAWKINVVPLVRNRSLGEIHGTNRGRQTQGKCGAVGIGSVIPVEGEWGCVNSEAPYRRVPSQAVLGLQRLRMAGVGVDP